MPPRGSRLDDGPDNTQDGERSEGLSDQVKAPRLLRSQGAVEEAQRQPDTGETDRQIDQENTSPAESSDEQPAQIRTHCDAKPSNTIKPRVVKNSARSTLSRPAKWS